MKRMILAAAAVSVFATAAAAQDVEIPLMVFMKPKPGGHCTFSLPTKTAACGSPVVYMEFDKHRRSDVSVQFGGVMFGFSGDLANQSGIAASFGVDRLMFGDKATPVPAQGQCHIVFEAPNSRDVSRVDCTALTQAGTVKLELTDASAEIVDKRQ